jgi:hypothetical protein
VNSVNPNVSFWRTLGGVQLNPAYELQRFIDAMA